MKERPILFSAPMVRAILEGHKTQTRRIVKPQPEAGADLGFLIPMPNANGSCAHFHDIDERGIHTKDLTAHCPYGMPGYLLWVREAWRVRGGREYEYQNDTHSVMYRATHHEDGFPLGWESYKWRPSIHMPRWASRIQLEVTGVRVERLNDISISDAIAEGYDGSVADSVDPSVKWYAQLWDAINGAGSWAANPWVWVVDFKRVQA